MSQISLSQGEGVEIPMEETPMEYIQRTASTSSRNSLRLDTASPSTKRGREEERLSGGEAAPWKAYPTAKKRASVVPGSGGAEVVQEVVIESTTSKIQIRLFGGGRMSPPTITTHEIPAAQSRAVVEDDHQFAVPEPRTIAVHAFSTDDAGQALTGTVPMQIAPSTSVADLFRMISQKTGTPAQSQHLVVIPSRTFSSADAEELRLKLCGQHPSTVMERVVEFSAHDGEESMEPIHGFVPPVRKASSKPIRDRMELLQRQLIEQKGEATPAQRLQWEDVIESERELLREEKATAPAIYVNLRNVVFDLRSEYWDIYKSVHHLIKTREPGALRKIAEMLSRFECPRSNPMQSRTDFVDLLQDGFKTKHRLYDPFMKNLAMAIGNIKYLPGELKGIWRMVEKSELKPTPAPERVFDIVRGALCASDIATLAAALEQLINSPEVQIVRVKNRLKEPTNSGWADCLVNFVFRDDPNRHVCELQFVHENLLLVRRNMGAHSRSYIWFRTALSLVEMDQRWTDECALLDLFTSADGPRWKKKDNWCSNAPLSRWFGVTVDQSGCVSKLKLDNNNLKGAIHETIGNLRCLRFLSLRNNHLRCSIPDTVSKLVSLRIMHLANNQLQGTIPKGLGNLTALQRLGLANNQLEGPIPKCFEVWTKITRLYLNDNKIEGRLPEWIGRLTSLQELYLSNNKLEGKIPDGIGHLTRLQHFVCGDNKLHGVIPDSICNLTNLYILTLNNNQLEGHIPQAIGNLVYLQQLELHENYIRGMIPDSITRLTDLSILHLNHNRLEGPIPDQIGEFGQLEQLTLNNNRLQGCIPDSVSQLTKLYWLHLQQNELEGPIPAGLGSLPTLQQLYLDNNRLEGLIPDSLGSLTDLSWLSLQNNKLSGAVPPSFSDLQELEELHLNDNELEGPIPVGVLWLIACEREVNFSSGMRLPGDLGELGDSLTSLVLPRRELVGSIPPSIGYLTSLQVLNLQGNRLTGTIPPTISRLVSLGWLDLSCNHLEGEIPSGICELSNLQELALHDNRLVGRIPDGIGRLADLQTLHLQNNQLQGQLPTSIIQLHHIHVLSVANNCLCGPIPDELCCLRYLEKLHLSGNSFGVGEEFKADLKRSLSTCSLRI